MHLAVLLALADREQVGFFFVIVRNDNMRRGTAWDQDGSAGLVAPQVYVCVCVHGGLCKFDGHRWDHFTSPPSFPPNISRQARASITLTLLWAKIVRRRTVRSPPQVTPPRPCCDICVSTTDSSAQKINGIIIIIILLPSLPVTNELKKANKKKHTSCDHSPLRLQYPSSINLKLFLMIRIEKAITVLSRKLL